LALCIIYNEKTPGHIGCRAGGSTYGTIIIAFLDSWW